MTRTALGLLGDEALGELQEAGADVAEAVTSQAGPVVRQCLAVVAVARRHVLSRCRWSLVCRTEPMAPVGRGRTDMRGYRTVVDRVVRPSHLPPKGLRHWGRTALLASGVLHDTRQTLRGVHVS